jgi:hypothetical protein
MSTPGVVQSKTAASDAKVVSTLTNASVFGGRAQRSAALSTAFEAIAHSSPELWILPPIQKIITQYDELYRKSSRCSPARCIGPFDEERR